MVKPMKAQLVKGRRLKRALMEKQAQMFLSAGDSHLEKVRDVLAAQFPAFATPAGTGPQLREFHPVTHLRTAYGNARPVPSLRRGRTLRSVALGSGVFAQQRIAALELLRVRQLLRRA